MGAVCTSEAGELSPVEGGEIDCIRSHLDQLEWMRENSGFNIGAEAVMMATSTVANAHMYERRSS